MREEITFYQKSLKLSNNLMEIYPNIEADSQEEFLLILLKELYEDRIEKRRLRNLNNAGFEVMKSLEDYDFSEVRFPEGLPLATLCSPCHFLIRKKISFSMELSGQERPI